MFDQESIIIYNMYGVNIVDNLSIFEYIYSFITI